MPKGYLRTSCKGCERPRSEVGTLSKRGLCSGCGEARRTANLACLVTHDGPYFDHWRAAMAASVGATLLDSERTRG